jgi:hypothetical protein
MKTGRNSACCSTRVPTSETSALQFTRREVQSHCLSIRCYTWYHDPLWSTSAAPRELGAVSGSATTRPRMPQSASPCGFRAAVACSRLAAPQYITGIWLYLRGRCDWTGTPTHWVRPGRRVILQQQRNSVQRGHTARSACMSKSTELRVRVSALRSRSHLVLSRYGFSMELSLCLDEASPSLRCSSGYCA